MVNFTETRALVTGGAQGIGRSFAEHLLAAGAKVAIGDLVNSAGPKTRQELDAKYPGKIIFLPCNVTDPAQFESAVVEAKKQLGGLNLIVNNAGIADESVEGWERMIDINITAVTRGTKLGFKYMGKDNGGIGGTVVNVASITSFTPWDPLPVYSGSKAYVNQMSRTYGRPIHFDPTGVKIISINPGLSDTAILQKAAVGIINDSPEMKANLANFIEIFPIQSVDNMGRGLITVLTKGQNGSMWVIENDEPAKEVKLEYTPV